MQIEEPVEEADVQRGHRFRGQQTHRPRMHKLQVLDDDAGLDDVAFAVYQQRKLAQRPAPQPFRRVLRLVRAEPVKLERRAVLVQRDEHFLRV